MSDTSPDQGELLAWCVVANVTAETTHGEGGEDVRRGLKHFAPGAKVWVLPPQWGDGGDSVFVIGRHRGRGHGRLARMVVGRHHLTDFRVRGVYSPAVHRELVRPWRQWGNHPLRLWESQDEAEQAVQWWTRVHAARSGVRRPQLRGDLIAILATFAADQPWPPLRYAVGRIVSGLFGDPADPTSAVGSLLRDHHEVAAISRVLDPLQVIVDELGSTPGIDDYLNHRRWSEVAAASRAAHVLLAGAGAAEDPSAT